MKDYRRNVHLSSGHMKLQVLALWQSLRIAMSFMHNCYEKVLLLPSYEYHHENIDQLLDVLALDLIIDVHHGGQQVRMCLNPFSFDFP